jgi:riboflavin synthase alpha subunit
MSWSGWESYIPPLRDAREQPAKRSKSGSVKTTRDGLTFDSAKEARRWTELRMLEKAGHIRWLKRQVKFSLDVNGHHVCDYVADAVYFEGKTRVVEDTKSVVTRRNRAYRIKVKLMLAVHGVAVKET